jgi:hypothetical protein
MPGFWGEGAAGELEILAEIARRLLENRLGATIAALLRSARIVADAVQADAQIRPAAMAAFPAAGLAGQGPFPAAMVTLSGRSHDDILSNLNATNLPASNFIPLASRKEQSFAPLSAFA